MKTQRIKKWEVGCNPLCFGSPLTILRLLLSQLPPWNCSFQLTLQAFFLWRVSVVPSISSSPGLVRAHAPRNTEFESCYFKKNSKNLENPFLKQESCFKGHYMLWTQKNIYWYQRLWTFPLFCVWYDVTNPKKMGRCSRGTRALPKNKKCEGQQYISVTVLLII